MGWGQRTGPLLPRVPAGRAAQEEGRGLALHFSGQHPGLREGPAPRVLPVWEVKSWATLSGVPPTHPNLPAAAPPQACSHHHPTRGPAH